MDKMRMESIDMTAQNVEKIGALFPNCITEMLDEERSTLENKVYKKAINFELLKQMLSGDVLEGDEAYEFTWVGKKASIVEANKPIRKTLRPCPEESVNWDTTENLYIEGDNLEVLKLLQESYLGKVKMIYIDPPYNTGNDFIYNDDFKMTGKEYADETGELDEDGNRMFRNTDSNGRFHSDWCSMIYSRLMLARNLLSDDGVIFISIDDNEVDNLKKVCDEIFGQSNFIGLTVRVSSPTQNIAKFMSIMHDYTLVYCKNKEVNGGDWRVPKNNVEEFESRANKLFKSGASQEEIATELRALVKYPRFYDFDHYYFCDEGGIFRAGPIGGVAHGNTTTQILHPVTQKPCKMPKGGWRYKDSEINRLVSENKLFFGKDETIVPQTKLYLHDYLMQIPKGINFFDTQTDVHFLSDNGLPFDFPKPVDYLEYLETMITDKDSIILDFFSGSATTAHAVMQLNAEDGGKRKFIMVQLPEKTDEQSEAYKAGYKNICEIGKERIRRAGKKIKEENPNAKDLDTGFRVLKLDDSNMTDVYYSANDYSQAMLATLESNIKSDRNDLDLLFGCLLEWGLPLSLPYCSEQIDGCTVHNYNDGDLIACFDENVPDSVIK